mmetsp:Transcript_96642/g.273691  ORF Transcript_96642/g.273691 Transcript_96642/m.273691 type:complete len:216 (-) Transcript_96642:684-1331(-)
MPLSSGMSRFLYQSLRSGMLICSMCWWSKITWITASMLPIFLAWNPFASHISMHWLKNIMSTSCILYFSLDSVTLDLSVARPRDVHSFCSSATGRACHRLTCFRIAIRSLLCMSSSGGQPHPLYHSSSSSMLFPSMSSYAFIRFMTMSMSPICLAWRPCASQASMRWFLKSSIMRYSLCASSSALSSSLFIGIFNSSHSNLSSARGNTCQITTIL